MKHALYFLFIADMQSLTVKGGIVPDIDLKLKSFKYTDSTVFQFICSTNIAVWQCNVEFLIEERTHDDFRYAENTCYHKGGICAPNICECSAGCESFKWNVTVTREMANHSYSCVSKMETNGVTYLATITVQRDTNAGFIVMKKIIVPLEIVTQPYTSSTISSELIRDSFTSVNIIIISVVSVTCILVFLLVVLFCWRISRSKFHKNELPKYQEPKELASDSSYGFDKYTTIEDQTEVRFPSSSYSTDKTNTQQRTSVSTQSNRSGSLEDIEFIPKKGNCAVWHSGKRNDSCA